ncbi:hypothetical protein D3C76_1629660 [compost metagenome]
MYQYVGVTSRGESRKLTLSLYEEAEEIVALFESDGSHGDPEVLERQIQNVVRRKKIRMEHFHSSQSSFQLRIPCDT